MLIILYIISLGFLFVCSELIEELVRPTDLKFGRGVGNTLSRNKFLISKINIHIFTKVLTNKSEGCPSMD